MKRPGLLLLALVLMGAAARLLHLLWLDSGLPGESGGLFLEFSRQIAATGFRLPQTIPYYTPGGIPYAYPPLAFYLQCALVYGLGVPEWPATHVLPPLISILSLPLFYILARAVFPDRVTPLVALGLYAVIPAAYLQQVQDEGLAEAVGSLAIILLALAMIRAERSERPVDFALLGLAGGLCVLAAPGSAAAAAMMLVVWGSACLFRAIRTGQTIRVFGMLALTALIALASSAPYWLAVGRAHGLGLFGVAILGQGAGDEGPIRGFIDRLLQFSISQAPYASLWDALILGGVILHLARRRWALPVWLVLLMAIPREWDWLVGLPAVLLAADALVVGSRWLAGQLQGYFGRQARQAIAVAGLVFVAYTALNVILSARANAGAQNVVRSAATLAAAEWARDNLPQAAVLVVPADAIREWVPHVAQRTTLNVGQGSEWQPEENRQIAALNTELEQCGTTVCLDAVLRNHLATAAPLYVLLNDPDHWQRYDSELTLPILYQNEGAAVLKWPFDQ